MAKTSRNRISKVSSPVKSKKKTSEHQDKKRSKPSKVVSNSKRKTKTKSKSKHNASPSKKTETSIPIIKTKSKSLEKCKKKTQTFSGKKKKGLAQMPPLLLGTGKDSVV